MFKQYQVVVIDMAALDSAAEISMLLDLWKKDEEERRSPINTLNRYCTS